MRRREEEGWDEEGRRRCGEGTESLGVRDGRKGKEIWGKGRISRISVFKK